MIMNFKEYFRETKHLLILKTIFAITGGLLPYVMSRMLIDIVNIISTDNIDYERVMPYFLILIFAVFWERIETTLKMPIDTLFDVRCREFVERFSCNMVRNTDYESVESAEFQEQYSHISRYVDHISQIWNKALDVISELIRFVSLTILIVGIKWYIAPILFCGVVPIWIEYRRKAEENNSFENDMQLVNNRINYYYEIMTNGSFLKEGKLFQYLPEVKSRWKTLKNHSIDQNFKYRIRRFIRELVYRVLQYSAFIVSIIILIVETLNGFLDVGSTIGMFSSMQTYQGNIAQLFFTFSEIKEIKLNYQEIKTLKIKYEFNKETNIDENNYYISNEIEFKNVSYQYKNKDEMALNNINVSIKKGETVFLVGLNGSGKSTFIKLLTGLYKPTYGHILYDGKSRDLIGNIYPNFTVLFQDYFKFPFTINDNISLWNDINQDVQGIEALIHNVGMKEFVEQLPEKGETWLGKMKKGSINLSEGQWQRIALARALYRNSDFFIFDEPTSSLDPIAESHIFELYSQIPVDKTKIIISHRLGYAKYTDKIIVFDKGNIVEQGSFAQLLERKGLFYKMYETQKELYLGEEESCIKHY